MVDSLIVTPWFIPRYRNNITQVRFVLQGTVVVRPLSGTDATAPSWTAFRAIRRTYSQAGAHSLLMIVKLASSVCDCRFSRDTRL
jgi:hypothetical protein